MEVKYNIKIFGILFQSIFVFVLKKHFENIHLTLKG